MNTRVKLLLALALVLAATAGAWAQPVGNWQHVHGQVQAVQGNHLTLKADDGRMFNVDISQVSDSVRSAMTPNLGVTVTGFPGTTPDRFTARYIVQDNPGAASATAAVGNDAVNRVLPLVPQFVESKEFQDRAATFRNNRAAARQFANQLYRGFLERDPSQDERRARVEHLLSSGDARGAVETFLRSPEYISKNKNERQVITDLYEAVLGRTPSQDEINARQQQIARR